MTTNMLTMYEMHNGDELKRYRLCTACHTDWANYGNVAECFMLTPIGHCDGTCSDCGCEAPVEALGAV